MIHKMSLSRIAYLSCTCDKIAFLLDDTWTNGRNVHMYNIVLPAKSDGYGLSLLGETQHVSM